MLRFAARYPLYLRRRLTVEEARATVRARLESRGENLLRWVGRAVFERPGSPYRELFRLAGCGLGDFQRAVRRDGVEAALESLRLAGVYVSFEEFKGRTPLVRQGRELRTDGDGFDNPFVAGALERGSSGSTGAPGRIMQDLDDYWSRAQTLAVVDAAHDAVDGPLGLWFGALPGCGTSALLSRLPYAGPAERWFTPLTARELRADGRIRLANAWIQAAARWTGASLPRPEPVALDQAVTIARWMRAALERAGRCTLATHVSLAVRVARAARENGIDLTGAVLQAGGEPPTSAKVGEILASGARFRPTYFFAEAGPVGGACVDPRGHNDLHVLEDRVALLAAPRALAGSDQTVDAFHVTTLLPTAPKLLLNVQIDDYGVLERRACGCALEREGYGLHVRDIRSFAKLTAEGMTLVGSEALRLVEEILPARFRASALDFQLAEVEDGSTSRLQLVVSPRVAASDQEIVAAVLSSLRDGRPGVNYARAIWSQAGTVQVVRRDPTVGAAGKVLPLDIARPPSVSRVR